MICDRFHPAACARGSIQQFNNTATSKQVPCCHDRRIDAAGGFGDRLSIAYAALAVGKNFLFRFSASYARTHARTQPTDSVCVCLLAWRVARVYLGRAPRRFADAVAIDGGIRGMRQRDACVSCVCSIYTRRSRMYRIYPVPPQCWVN